MTRVPDARHYRGYHDLAREQRRGIDYDISVHSRPESTIAILAPHGGSIEDGTSEIARAIAAEAFNLYLLEGRRASQNYQALHLTSHRFDEPECLQLLASCRHVVAIHGCDGSDTTALLGGLDLVLRDRIAAALSEASVSVSTEGHRFPASHPDNICNRGATARGVQLELPHSLRRSGDALLIAAVVHAVLLATACPLATAGPSGERQPDFS